MRDLMETFKHTQTHTTQSHSQDPHKQLMYTFCSSIYNNRFKSNCQADGKERRPTIHRFFLMKGISIHLLNVPKKLVRV